MPGTESFQGVLLSNWQVQRYAILNASQFFPISGSVGLGKPWFTHVLSKAKLLGVHRVNIGIIAEHSELKNWYKAIGFAEGENKEFARLPFRVTFMSYEAD